jgi:hypothetical protein
MFTITGKLRTVVAVSAAGAALASTGVASAATPLRSPLSTHRPVATTTSVAQEAGSAGVPGYDDERCQELLGESLHYEDKFQEDLLKAQQTPMGTPEHQQAVDAAHYDTETAYQDKQELSDNCLVVD